MLFEIEKHTMFRMKQKLLALLLLPALLTSCSGSLSLQFVPYTDYVSEKETVRDYEDDYFRSYKETTPVTHKDGTIDNPIELNKVNRYGKTRTLIPTTGERKLLVVPVYFTDSDTSLLDKKTTFIQNAFFGETKRTEYDSVAGYYNKSSYGHLKLTGEVAPWFNIGISSDKWTTLSTSHNEASSIIAAKAVDYIKENNLISDLSSYDTNEDGCIDGVYVIYDHPFGEEGNSSSLYWAYVYFAQKNEHGFNNVEPYVNAYAWTSVNAITDAGEKKDNKSYTNYLIHETGHLLGLSDYYNTKGDSSSYQPTGLFDMMDYNVGDHSAFSKYLLKWTSPLVVKENVSFTYKLKPFIDSGETILIPSSNYENSPYGEYLLVEYFVPNELNKCNEQFEYASQGRQTAIYRYPQHYGLKIYHVNALLGYYKIGGVVNTKYLAALNDPDYASKIEGETVGIDYIYDNSLGPTDAKNGEPVFYHLLESSGENTFINGTPANNKTLFSVGSDFGVTKFTDFKFSTGEKPKFQLKVAALSSEYATLEINTK